MRICILFLLVFIMAGIGKDISISCASNSMWPTMDCHSILDLRFLHASERTNLSVGDIVFYSPTPQQRYVGRQRGFHVTTTWVVHRIANVTADGYMLKGDNNNFYDNDYFGVIRPYQITYRVERIL